MKISVKQSVINDAYAVLTTAKMAKFEFKEQKAVFAVINALHPLAESYKSKVEDVRKRLRPEYWDDVRDLIDKVVNNVATKEEKITYLEKVAPYFRDVNLHIADLDAVSHEIDVEPLSEALVYKMMDSSDWDASAAIALNFITKQE